jgi:tRNA-splicing ligase RtcB
MSRSAAKRRLRGRDVRERLRERGIIVRSASQEVLAEEATEAYKDVDRVADVCHRLELARKVARLIPMAVVKG